MPKKMINFLMLLSLLVFAGPVSAADDDLYIAPGDETVTMGDIKQDLPNEFPPVNDQGVFDMDPDATIPITDEQFDEMVAAAEKRCKKVAEEARKYQELYDKIANNGLNGFDPKHDRILHGTGTILNSFGPDYQTGGVLVSNGHGIYYPLVEGHAGVINNYPDYNRPVLCASCPTSGPGRPTTPHHEILAPLIDRDVIGMSQVDGDPLTTYVTTVEPDGTFTVRPGTLNGPRKDDWPFTVASPDGSLRPATLQEVRDMFPEHFNVIYEGEKYPGNIVGPRPPLPEVDYYPEDGNIGDTPNEPTSIDANCQACDFAAEQRKLQRIKAKAEQALNKIRNWKPGGGLAGSALGFLFGYGVDRKLTPEQQMALSEYLDVNPAAGMPVTIQNAHNIEEWIGGTIGPWINPAIQTTYDGVEWLEDLLMSDLLTGSYF